MNTTRSILMRMFGCPTGIVGRLGGIIMARSNHDCAAWVIDLLDVRLNENVLEVGFGPGVAIELLTNKLGPTGCAAGVDPSSEMVGQATARNARAIASGAVDLRHGSVEKLPFQNEKFHKALAINSLHVWPDPIAGLREIRRVLKPGGRVAVGFTPYSGQPNCGLSETLTAAGLMRAHLVETRKCVCALAIKPYS